MYFYFYDKLTQDKQYEPLLVKVETRLIDLGLNGRVEKLSIFKNAREIIRDAVKKGAKTIIAVGDDKTFTNLVNMVATHDVTLGFIPMTPGGVFSQLLGIPSGEAACDVLSKRLCLTLDLGYIQDYYFLGAVSTEIKHETDLRCNDQYTVHVPAHTRMTLANVGDIFSQSPQLESATDGRLTLSLTECSAPSGFFRRRKTRSEIESRLFPASVALSSAHELTLTADATTSFHTPCSVSIAPHALKVIVGRDRQLA